MRGAGVGSFGGNTDEIPSSGLKLWFDGRKPTYSDPVASVLASPYAGLVRASKQTPPGTWLAPSPGTRGLREPNAVNCQQGPASVLNQPVGVTLPTNNASIFFAFVPRNSKASLIQGVCGGLDSAGQLWGLELYDTNNTLAVNLDGSPALSAITVPVGVPCVGVLSFNGIGWNITARVNGGAPVTSTVAQVPAAGRTISSLVLGSIQATQNMHGAVYQLGGYDHALSAGDKARVLAFLSSLTLAPNFPTQLPLIVGIGDSITAGFQLTSQNNAWPQAMIVTLNPANPLAPVNVLNAGLSGLQLAAIQAAYPTNVLPFLSASRAKNVQCVGGGTNNFIAGQTAATVLTAYWSLVATAVAASNGGPVYAQTLLPGAGIDNTQRALFNADVSTNFAAHGCAGVINFAGIAGMGADGDNTGANYQSDHIHPNDAGAALMTPVAAARVQTGL